MLRRPNSHTTTACGLLCGVPSTPQWSASASMLWTTMGPTSWPALHHRGLLRRRTSFTMSIRYLTGVPASTAAEAAEDAYRHRGHRQRRRPRPRSKLQKHLEDAGVDTAELDLPEGNSADGHHRRAILPRKLQKSLQKTRVSSLRSSPI